MNLKDGKTLEEICDFLGIPQYAKRIWNSNSRGELIHLSDYVEFYKVAKNNGVWREDFPVWFESVVREAERSWKNPDAVFQHMRRIYNQHIEYLRYAKKGEK